MTDQLVLPLKQASAAGIDAIALDSPAKRATTLRRMREQMRSTIYAMNGGGQTMTWWGFGQRPTFVSNYLRDGGKLADLACDINQIEALPT